MTAHDKVSARWYVAWTLVWLVATLGFALLVAGCQVKSLPAETRVARASEGPVTILLVTVEGLGPAALADPRVMPFLVDTAGVQQWSVAVLPCPDPQVAMAGILTGVEPWRLGIVGRPSEYLSEHYRTLPEILRDRGWQTTAVTGSEGLGSHGLVQGIERSDHYDALPAMLEALLKFDPERSVFAWAHLARAAPPWRIDRDRAAALEAAGALPVPASSLPRRLRAQNPATSKQSVRRLEHAMYLNGLAVVDAQIRAISEAGESRLAHQAGMDSSRPARLVVAVVGTRGADFGAHSSVPQRSAANAGILARRESVEVVYGSLPGSLAESSLIETGVRRSTDAVFPLLLEAAGESVPPRVLAASPWQRSACVTDEGVLEVAARRGGLRAGRRGPEGPVWFEDWDDETFIPPAVPGQRFAAHLEVLSALDAAIAAPGVGRSLPEDTTAAEARQRMVDAAVRNE